MDKQNVVCSYYRILLNNKKEQSGDIRNMGYPQKYVSTERSWTHAYISFGSIDMKFLRSSITENRQKEKANHYLKMSVETNCK